MRVTARRRIGSPARPTSQQAATVGTNPEAAKSMKTLAEAGHSIATAQTSRPGHFPIGSIESRAAARALAEAKLQGTSLAWDLQRAVLNPLIWLQRHTRMRDSHWRESGASSPYRSFPEKPYFPALIQIFQAEAVIIIEKSRDMMLSWLCVGFFTHAAMTNDQREVLFQSQKEDKAAGCIASVSTASQDSPCRNTCRTCIDCRASWTLHRSLQIPRSSTPLGHRQKAGSNPLRTCTGRPD